MSHLKNKSKQNFEAAIFLIEKELHASSIHCSYYGMLQFLTCKYADCLNKSFEDITIETREGEGTHNYIINGLIKYIKSTYRKDPDIDYVQQNVKNTNIQLLHRKIKDLKGFRVKSDYRDIPIDRAMGEKVYNLSLEVTKKIEEFIQ